MAIKPPHKVTTLKNAQNPKTHKSHGGVSNLIDTPPLLIINLFWSYNYLRITFTVRKSLPSLATRTK